MHGGGDGDSGNFTFAVHFDLGFASFVAYFSAGRSSRDTGGADPAFDALAARFFARGPEGDAFRRARLKVSAPRMLSSLHSLCNRALSALLLWLHCAVLCGHACFRFSLAHSQVALVPMRARPPPPDPTARCSWAVGCGEGCGFASGDSRRPHPPDIFPRRGLPGVPRGHTVIVDRDEADAAMHEGGYKANDGPRVHHPG